MMFDYVVIYGLSLILTAIMFIHIYWLFGGDKGLDATLPHDIKPIKKRYSKLKQRLFRVILIGPVVAILFFLILSLHPILPIIEPYKHTLYLCCAIAFIVRATLGGYVLNHLSKKTLFIRYNTWCYSPLSLVIAGAFLYLFSV